MRPAVSQDSRLVPLLHPQIYNTRAPTSWTGGGYDPAYPMWRLHGADGQLYFVGIDGNVYTPKQLPTLPGTTFITQQ
jgi:hypothetical protein